MTIQRGFTLIEMAIVLVIVTILIGGLAMPLSAQIQARRIAETSVTEMKPRARPFLAMPWVMSAQLIAHHQLTPP